MKKRLLILFVTVAILVTTTPAWAVADPPLPTSEPMILNPAYLTELIRINGPEQVAPERSWGVKWIEESVFQLSGTSSQLVSTPVTISNFNGDAILIKLRLIALVRAIGAPYGDSRLWLGIDCQEEPSRYVLATLTKASENQGEFDTVFADITGGTAYQMGLLGRDDCAIFAMVDNPQLAYVWEVTSLRLEADWERTTHYQLALPYIQRGSHVTH